MKNGFTLVELLAVIIILTLIMAIVSPIVLKTVNNSRSSLSFVSAEKYIDAVEQAVLEKNLNEKFKPKDCAIDNNGNLTCDDVLLEIEVDGKKPKGGNITFVSRKAIYASLIFEKKTIVLNPNGEFVEGPICKLIDGKANTIGSKYQCRVKDDMEEGFEEGYYFFVLSHNDDGSTNLIMDRNIHYDSANDVGKATSTKNKGRVEWNLSSNHSYGPVTAMTYLHNATKDWDNIPNMIMDYVDEKIYNNTTIEKSGYDGIKTTENITVITSKTGEETCKIENLKTRMPMYSEVTGEGKCTPNNGSCPKWLASNDGSNVALGYWLLSSYGAFSGNSMNIILDGYIGNSPITGRSLGVRPVITLKL